ncbi:hypothetical protein BCR34DRAFT_603045 [Clohesyomyces aquaticus]|uniref:Uncharacterized protein n=1 Tax=Clohesyomyces aquaticus TaxID=1231657 RepID=A0A1Y1ZG18_9PLEO|nr:hypothetical protein BCR34DRAFT_603045 [Clohesyomyces aquaticus]
MKVPHSNGKGRLMIFRICAWLSFWFTTALLILGNTYGNATQFARGVLLFTPRTSASLSDLDQAVTLRAGALTVICSIWVALKPAAVAEEKGLRERDAEATGSDDRVAEVEENTDTEIPHQDMPVWSDLGVQLVSKGGDVDV